MKIKYLTEEGIDNIKETLVSVHGRHLLDASPDYFVDTFSKNGWLRESKYEVPDVEFNMNPDYNLSDSVNISRVYECMRSLPCSVASDERVWAGLAFTDMWKFVQYRRAEDLNSGDDNAKLNSFVFMRGRRRSCYIHCIARLWWTAYILYDAKREDPYELCKYFASRAFPSRIMLFSSTNLVSNPEIAKGIIQAHYDRHKEGKPDGRYPYTDTNKYWNCLGGIMILDSFTRQEVYDKSMAFLEENFPL